MTPQATRLLSRMQDNSNNKIWHFLAGAIGTVVFFALLTATPHLLRHRSNRPSKDIWSLDCRLLGSALLAVLSGTIQEIVYAVRQKDNKFDIWNLGIHLNGVVCAVLFLVVLHVLLSYCQTRRPNDGMTVAVGDEEDLFGCDDASTCDEESSDSQGINPIVDLNGQEGDAETNVNTTDSCSSEV